jgi:hypothetical protein
MPTGIGRDLDRLKQGGAASAAEIREFIAKLRGRSPQEVLGMVAQSNLISSVTLATLATVLLFAVFTVGPYLLGQTAEANRPGPSKETPTASPDTTAAAPAPTNSTNRETVTPTAQAVQPADTKILEKLDMDETKQADPTVNPLEEQGDDLLKELK